MIKWKPGELIYIFRVLLNFVIQCKEIGYYHSNITTNNIIVEYNHKNSRIEIKVINFHDISQKWNQKKKIHNYIFGP